MNFAMKLWKQELGVVYESTRNTLLFNNMDYLREVLKWRRISVVISGYAEYGG